MKRGFGDSEDAAHPKRTISNAPAQEKYAAPGNGIQRRIHTTKNHAKVINTNAAEKPPNMHKIRAARRRSDKLPGPGVPPKSTTIQLT